MVNKEGAVVWSREPDWGAIYKAADYHHVSNALYGLLLAMEGKQLVKWKGRFEERFRFTVVMQERYLAAEQEITAAMERGKIHCMELQGAVLTRCYERSEQRYPEPLRFFVEKGKDDLIGKAMQGLGFEKRAERGKKEITGETCYYRMGGTYAVFYEVCSFTRKKMSRYFSIPPQDFPKKKGYHFVHQQDKEDFYLYYMAYLTERYAKGEVEIKDILDLWELYLSCYKELEWKDVYKELEYLELGDFADLTVKLAASWFGRMGDFKGEMPQLYAMEEYILSKGAQAREENEKLLPLVKELADIYERDIRKEQRKKQLQLWFPEREYMQAIYPSLSKTLILLPLCWLHRIIKSQFKKIKNAVARRVQAVKAKKDDLAKRWKERRKKEN